MENSFPWVIAALSGVLVLLLALVVILARSRNGSGRGIFTDIDKRVFLTQFILGLAFSLTGGFLMFNGELLGDETTGIARIFGIVGISLIATSTPIGIAVKKRFHS